MIIIPGELIALMTFPGVIMHEISHRLVCDILRVPVYAVCYFKLDSQQVGYVMHAPIASVTKTLLIGIAPLFINSILCILFTFPLSSSWYIAGDTISCQWIYKFLWWIGFSMGAQAFPSNQDVDDALNLANQVQFFLVFPISFIIEGLNFFRRVWLSLAYAYGLSFVLPYFLFA